MSEDKPRYAGNQSWVKLADAHFHLIGARREIEQTNFGLAAQHIEHAADVLRELMTACEPATTPVIYVGHLSDITA